MGQTSSLAHPRFSLLHAPLPLSPVPRGVGLDLPVPLQCPLGLPHHTEEHRDTTTQPPVTNSLRPVWVAHTHAKQVIFPSSSPILHIRPPVISLVLFGGPSEAPLALLVLIEIQRLLQAWRVGRGTRAALGSRQLAHLPKQTIHCWSKAARFECRYVCAGGRYRGGARGCGR